MSFICPDCGRESFNPNDERYRYCGACHKFFSYPEISPDGFINVDVLGATNPAHAAAYAALHLQMLQIKEQYPGEYEKALEALRCMYDQKNSGRHESWRGRFHRAWTRFARAMSRSSS